MSDPGPVIAATSRKDFITPEQYDAMIRKWNRIGANNRLMRTNYCKQEAHDWRTYDDAQVCIRCVHYRF